MDHIHSIKIFSGRASRYLAEKIAKSLNLDLGKSVVTVFSDGEFQPAFDESVRGCTLFIVQSTFTESLPLCHTSDGLVRIEKTALESP